MYGIFSYIWLIFMVFMYLGKIYQSCGSDGDYSQIHLINLKNCFLRGVCECSNVTGDSLHGQGTDRWLGTSIGTSLQNGGGGGGVAVRSGMFLFLEKLTLSP